MGRSTYGAVGAAGIADFEGLLEQVGPRDWTHTVMG